MIEHKVQTLIHSVILVKYKIGACVSETLTTVGFYSSI